MRVEDLSTPALVVDAARLEANLALMAATRPGPRLRPHVKAHKSTALAARQAAHGHQTFTVATPREAIGMAEAGLGTDVLVANEVVDPARLGLLADLVRRDKARITVAVDSPATVHAAAKAGLREVLIDVNVGLPRCGVAVDEAGALADTARSHGLAVRGVMGYEGHLMMVSDRAEQQAKVDDAVDLLLQAHGEVGGDVVSSGGTGTYDLHMRTGEVQAGSYVLMDSHYATLGLPFQQALWVVGTIISAQKNWLVADVGLKSLGMDHGAPSIDGAKVWFCSDEHVTFAPERDADGAGSASSPRLRVGDRVRVTPAHIDPTIAMHEALWLVDSDGSVVDRWSVDLRGW